LDSVTNVALPGVAVSIITPHPKNKVKDTLTDANGVFIFEKIIVDNNYVVSFSLAGYTTKNEVVTIKPFGDTSESEKSSSVGGSNTNTGAVYLTSSSITGYGKLTGYVTDSVSKEPIQGVAVSVAGKSATTDTNGVYDIPTIPVGRYTISYTKAGYITTNDNVFIDAYPASNDSNVSLSLTGLAVTSSAGSITAPLARDGKITLTFSRPIAVETFGVNYSGTGFYLVQNWTGNTQVDLTLSSTSTNGAILFPYSNNVGTPIGSFTISGYTADDKTNINPNSSSIYVYTVEKLRLVSVDPDATAPTGATPNVANVPSKSIYVTPGKVIKLTFNKPIENLKSNFYWNSSLVVMDTATSFKVSGNDVYVDTGALVKNEVKVLRYTVYSASDLNDTITGAVDGNGFEIKDTLVKLKLKDTDDLYPGKHKYDHPEVATSDRGYTYDAGGGFFTPLYRYSELGIATGASVDFILNSPPPQGISYNYELLEGSAWSSWVSTAGTTDVTNTKVVGIGFYLLTSGARTEKFKFQFQNLSSDKTYFLRIQIMDNTTGSDDINRYVFNTDDPDCIYEDTYNYAWTQSFSGSGYIVFKAKGP